MNLIGSGCVVHVPSFFQELENVQKKGLDTEDRIYISDRAHLVFDLHQLVDGLEESELGPLNIGTTRKGIGPTYSSKAARSGLRVYELFNWPEFEKRFRALVNGYQKRYEGMFEYDVQKELERYKVCSFPIPCFHRRDLLCFNNRNMPRSYAHTLSTQSSLWPMLRRKMREY